MGSSKSDSPKGPSPRGSVGTRPTPSGSQVSATIGTVTGDPDVDLMADTLSHRTASHWPWWMSFFGLLTLWALLFVPSIGAAEFHDEEARRAVPAREMLASGDFVKPTLFGNPYLNKPPLYMWAVAASSKLTGGVNETAVRLPAILGTLFGAFAVFLFAHLAIAPRAAPWAGILYLLAWHVFEKGRLGEIEALLGPLVFAAVAALWGAPNSWRAAGIAGLTLGAAFLAKGPPALAFVGAGYVALAFTRERHIWKRASTYAPLLIGMIPIGIWIYLLMQEAPFGQVLERWTGEIKREGNGGWLPYIKDRGRYIAGVLLGLFPASFLLIGALVGTKDKLSPAGKYMLLCAGLSLLVFALPVGTRPRYGFPAAGFVAVAASAYIAMTRLRGPRFRSLPSWIPTGALCGLSGVLVALFGVGSFAWDPLKIGVPSGASWLVLAVAGASGAIALRRALSPLRRDFLPYALLAFAAGRSFEVLHLAPIEALDRPNYDLAAGVEELRENGATIWTRAQGEHNAQAYLDPAPVWLSAGDSENDSENESADGFPTETNPRTSAAKRPAPGDLLLLLPMDAAAWSGDVQWEVVLMPEEQMTRWRVLRRVGVSR